MYFTFEDWFHSQSINVDSNQYNGWAMWKAIDFLNIFKRLPQLHPLHTSVCIRSHDITANNHRLPGVKVHTSEISQMIWLYKIGLNCKIVDIISERWKHSPHYISGIYVSYHEKPYESRLNKQAKTTDQTKTRVCLNTCVHEHRISWLH